jgi:hypothetical protein
MRRNESPHGEALDGRIDVGDNPAIVFPPLQLALEIFERRARLLPLPFNLQEAGLNEVAS